VTVAQFLPGKTLIVGRGIPIRLRNGGRQNEKSKTNRNRGSGKKPGHP
jgi:hypothetical protein